MGAREGKRESPSHGCGCYPGITFFGLNAINMRNATKPKEWGRAVSIQNLLLHPYVNNLI